MRIDRHVAPGTHRAMTDASDHMGAIFDMDGTLVDSYEAHFESWRTTLSDHGITYEIEEFAREFGRRNPEIITELWADRGLETPSTTLITEVADAKEAAFRELISAEFPMMPGADALLGDLHREGWRIAIGSSAPRENVELCIEKMGIAGFLHGVATGGDVKRGKPHPDVFLHAADLIGVPPGNCIVVEDAAAGIEAAHNAGMPAAVIASRGRTREELHAAELCVDSLDELGPGTLGQLIKEHVA